MLQFLFRISPQRIVCCAHNCYHYDGSFPNSDNFEASSSEVAAVVPPWLTSKSEDVELLAHKIEVHACKMAMEHVYFKRSKRVS